MTAQVKPAAVVRAYDHLSQSAEQIDKSINYVRTTAKNLQDRVHSTALAIILQSMPISEGGFMDCSRAVALFNAMGEAGRRNALVQWFERYSNIRFTSTRNPTTKKIEVKAHMLRPEHPDYRTASPLTAEQNPFWTLKAMEADFVMLGDKDFAKALASLVARFSDKDKAALHGANKDRLKALKEMAAAAAPPASAKAPTKGVQAKNKASAPKMQEQPAPAPN